MDILLYQKALEGQELLIEKQLNFIKGFWILNGKKESFIDIASFPFKKFPLIKDNLNFSQKLIMGFSKEKQLFYALMLNDNLFVEACEVGHSTLEVLDKLNTSLIYGKTMKIQDKLIRNR